MALSEEIYETILSNVKKGMAVNTAIRHARISDSTYYSNVSYEQKEVIRKIRYSDTYKGTKLLSEKDKKVIRKFCEKFDAITPKEVIGRYRLRAALIYCIWFCGEYTMMPLSKTLAVEWNIAQSSVYNELTAYLTTEKDPYLRKIVDEITQTHKVERALLVGD